jgi:uroporphyrinogen-III synthase
VIRVAVTTDRFSKVAPYFARAGLEPISTPCIHVIPATAGALARARVAAGEADLMVVTSARTVALLWPAGGMPSCDIAVVGPGTAKAVTAAGGRVVTTGRGGIADLVDAVADSLHGRQVVVLRAAGTDPVALRRLLALAPALEDHVVYRVVPIGPEGTAVDAVAFASPSAVEGWLLTRSLNDLVVGVIGDTTAEAVASHRDPDVVASQPSFPALARALGSLLEVTS